MHSVGQGRIAELMSDEVIQPGLSCASIVARGGKSFPEFTLPSTPTRSLRELDNQGTVFFSGGRPQLVVELGNLSEVTNLYSAQGN